MKLPKIVENIGIAVGAIFFLGFGVQSSDFMPGYAAVYLDDENRTYIALPCMDEWSHRRSKDFAFARLSTAVEAWKLKYEMDDHCREAGGYEDDGRSLSGMFLEWVGILPPKKHWWDKPYRTESGIVQPHP